MSHLFKKSNTNQILKKYSQNKNNNIIKKIKYIKKYYKNSRRSKKSNTFSK